MLFLFSFHQKLFTVFHPELRGTAMVTEGIPVKLLMKNRKYV
jgi:hypothetical protein